MNWDLEEENKIRRYLLGDLSGDAVQQVEENLLRDDEYADWVLVIEDELIDDYTHDAMSARDKKFFNSHFLSTQERRYKLALAKEFSNYAAEDAADKQPQQIKAQNNKEDRQYREQFRAAGGWRQELFSGWKLAVYAILIIGIGWGVGLWRQRDSEANAAMKALNQAYREERFVKVRVTGLDFAPYKEQRGGEQPQVNVNARNRAERLLLDAVAEKPTPSVHHALGRFYLARKDFEPAISEFEAALKDAPNNAQLHSDLGAALFERSKSEARDQKIELNPSMLNRSLEHLNRSLELDNSLLPALFNRALLRQSVGLLPLAREDWGKYLQRETNTAWAEEARIQLRQIEGQLKKVSLKEERLLQDFRQAYRARDEDAAWRVYSQSHWRQGNYIADSLIDDFLEATLSTQPEQAQAHLQALSYISRVALEKSGDWFIGEIEQFYSHLPPAHAPALAQARALMKSAYQIGFVHSQDRQAREIYEQACNLFAKHQDYGEALLARLWLGVCHLRQSDLQQGRAAFDLVLLEGRKRQYKWLQALALNSLANVQQRMNEYSKAIESCQQARQIAQELADDNGQLRSLNLLAALYSRLGKFHEAWRVAQQGIELAESVVAEPSQTIGFYSVAARSFNALGQRAMALECAQETLRLGKAMNSPPLVMSNYEVNLGLVYGKLTRYDEALRHIRRGLEIGQSLQPEENAQEMVIYALLYLGQIQRLAGALEDAGRSLDEAAELSQQKRRDWLLYHVAKERLLTLLAQGRTEAAQMELQRVLNFYEANRAAVLEESNRNSFFHQEQDIYDVAIDFAATRLADPAQAFRYSESSRSRSLLDAFSGDAKLITEPEEVDLRFSGTTRPLELNQVSARMPDNVQLLQYAVLEDKLLIWLISKKGIQSRIVPVSAARLSELVSEYLKQVATLQSKDKQSVARMEEALYELVLQPIAQQLAPGKPLCIIPDKILNFLPFGVLISPATKRYLIEDFLLTYAPSASLFVLYTEAAQLKEHAEREQALIVGNPSFDRKAFPTLTDLPASAREANEVAEVYGASSCLRTGPQALKAFLLWDMKKADVIHLALHHVSEPSSPMHSKLLLAEVLSSNGQSAAADSVLTASEIYQLKLRRARLVVLSACQTWAEDYFAGEGAIGISRPFLASGIPQVVASLWAVDSSATAELMIYFHRIRKQQKLPTAAALREAQLKMLREPASPYQHPYHWASFLVVGGASSF